jgi:hypothetical protein
MANVRFRTIEQIAALHERMYRRAQHWNLLVLASKWTQSGRTTCWGQDSLLASKWTQSVRTTCWRQDSLWASKWTQSVGTTCWGQSIGQ